MRRVCYQPIPVIMADLVAEMAKRCAIELPHFLPEALALGVVGLGDVDGNKAIHMSRHDRRLRGAEIFKKLKRQAGGIFPACFERQAKLNERVEQPMLGDFQRAPFLEIVGEGKVRNDAIMARSEEHTSELQSHVN